MKPILIGSLPVDSGVWAEYQRQQHATLDAEYQRQQHATLEAEYQRQQHATLEAEYQRQRDSLLARSAQLSSKEASV